MSAESKQQDINITAQLKSFVDACKQSQLIWGLLDPQTNDWVICDSSEFEETDVLPLWSDKDQAFAFCTDEWAAYRASSISVDEYLEQWVTDLNYDGVLLGINWDVEQELEEDGAGSSIEVDPIDVAKAFADCEIEFETNA